MNIEQAKMQLNKLRALYGDKSIDTLQSLDIAIKSLDMWDKMFSECVNYVGAKVNGVYHLPKNDVIDILLKYRKEIEE